MKKSGLPEEEMDRPAIVICHSFPECWRLPTDGEEMESPGCPCPDPNSDEQVGAAGWGRGVLGRASGECGWRASQQCLCCTAGAGSGAGGVCGLPGRTCCWLQEAPAGCGFWACCAADAAEALKPPRRRPPTHPALSHYAPCRRWLTGWAAPCLRRRRCLRTWWSTATPWTRCGGQGGPARWCCAAAGLGVRAPALPLPLPSAGLAWASCAAGKMRGGGRCRWRRPGACPAGRARAAAADDGRPAQPSAPCGSLSSSRCGCPLSSTGPPSCGAACTRTSCAWCRRCAAAAGPLAAGRRQPAGCGCGCGSAGTRPWL
jgi:hypothetical protein